MVRPVASRPTMPGYGIEAETGPLGESFGWDEVAERFGSARTYWIATSHRDRPHVAPVWGAWFPPVLVFDSGRDSLKTRNILANPAVVAHVDGGENAIIARGEARPLDDPDLLRRFAEAYREKYDWSYDPSRPPGIPFALRVRAIVSFREDLGDTATRWTF